MNTPVTGIDTKRVNPFTHSAARISAGLMILVISFGILQAQTDWPHVVQSKDGTQISYEIYSGKEPTLVFVHGWSCDSRYWRAQLPHFSGDHRVITIDLAGHGHSGTARTEYTMKAFGEDVKAVSETIDSDKLILIGHSMGATVVAEAARLLPDRVLGLISIDALEDIEYNLTREELDMMMAPIKNDFRTGTRQFAQSMIRSDTDPQIRDWILDDMSSALPDVGLSAMNELMSLYITGDMARLFDEVRLPVVTVHGDMWPINYEANRRHMLSFDAIILKDSDHFLMIDRAAEFNTALEKAIDMIVEKSEK